MSLNLNATKIGFDDIESEDSLIAKKRISRKLYAGTVIKLIIDEESIEVTLPANTETDLLVE